VEFSRVIRDRKDIRKFLEKGVEEKKIEQLLEMANQAPSAGNLQSLKAVIVSEKAKRRAIAQAAYGQEFVGKAPVVFVICANKKESARRYGERGSGLYAVQDATIYATFLVLSAHELGLATCWVGAFDSAKVAEIIEADQGIEPVALITLGYADENPSKPMRKKPEDYVHREVFE
jgi:nitroreductase